jgi:beta-N-acetylhexosaminidase
MVALATYTRIDPANLAVFSPIVMRAVLRGDLGFDGVIMSDSLTAAAVASIPSGRRAIDFLVAGGDLVVVRSTKVAVAMVTAVLARTRSDVGFAARVDNAILRVLEAKQVESLLPCSG